jgi:hypothetical protein
MNPLSARANCDIENIDFIDELWLRKNGKLNTRKIIVDEIFLLKQIEDDKSVPYNITPDQVTQLYRKLRNNFEESKRYSEAGDFHIGEMEITRKYTIDQDGTVLKKSWFDPLKILLTSYSLVSQYGESIASPLLWSILLIFGSSIFISYLELPETFFHSIPIAIKTTLTAFFPFFRIEFKYIYLIIRSLGSVLIGLIFIAIRRKLERK